MALRKQHPAPGLPELMQVDTVSALELPGFSELEISPRSVEFILKEMLESWD
jgi:hypothetical protein